MDRFNYNQPLKVFSLPEEILNDATFFKSTSNTLKSEKPFRDINKEEETQQHLLTSTTPTTISTPKSNPFSCLVCGITNFKDVEQQRAHFKLDWHRYNVKRHVKYLEAGKFKSYQPISEQNFEEIING